MKKYICLFILLVSVLGLLISCNGKQRPLDEGQAQAAGADDGAADGGATASTEAGAQATDSGATTAVGDSTGSAGGDVQQEESKVVFSDIQPLFQKHCAICHIPGAPPDMPAINWVDYAIAKSYVDNGKLYKRMWTLRGDDEKGMPMGNPFEMTTEERELIVSWIQGGGLQ